MTQCISSPFSSIFNNFKSPQLYLIILQTDLIYIVKSKKMLQICLQQISIQRHSLLISFLFNWPKFDFSIVFREFCRFNTREYLNELVNFCSWDSFCLRQQVVVIILIYWMIYKFLFVSSTSLIVYFNYFKIVSCT